MEPNKLENQIREKLHSREIQPSAQAWDRLDAMLTVAEEKKTKRFPFLTFRFIGIAASVLVFVTLGALFFTQKDAEIQPQNNVVGTEVKIDTTVKTPNSKFQISTNKENQVAVSNQPTSSNQRVSINNQATPNNHKQSANPLINREKPIEFQNSADIALKDLPKIMDTKPIVVDNRPKIKSDEQLLSSLDIAAKQSVNQKSVVKVDAKSLLSQVDGELEMTFREKVINKVSKNYKEVKVALANRNNE
ncbi:hypothetical protein [Flavobacterium sp. 25HG05S-40]|uniref:hypothetical protein n=1 Tax=Flavobacterium sp. 25HG05S-40 TaxID=3458682 RepID=UPI0040449E4F